MSSSKRSSYTFSVFGRYFTIEKISGCFYLRWTFGELIGLLKADHEMAAGAEAALKAAEILRPRRA